MKKQNGFTAVEFLIVVAIVGIVGSMIASFSQGEVKCINNYKFTNARYPVQIIDEHGRGIPCKAE